MKSLPRLFCLSIAPLALAACQGEQKPAEAKTAQGEILAGSASDAMLPLDTVRSQPPLAPQTEAAGKSGKAKPDGNAADEGEEDDGETEASEPAAAPSLSPDPAQ